MLAGTGGPGSPLQMAVVLKKPAFCAGRSKAVVDTVFAPRTTQKGPKLAMKLCAAEMLAAPPQESPKFMEEVASLPSAPLGAPLVNWPLKVVTPDVVASRTSPAPS